VILFAHGSRDPRWKEPFEKLESRLSRHSPGVMVRAAYLQDSVPDIYQAASEMTDNGVSQITVIPMFLAVGAHSANDFPKIETRLKEAHPTVHFKWTSVLGEWDETQEALVSLMAEKISAAD